MEFATRPCKPGDQKALSLVAQATILETYAGITEGDDLITHATTELSVDNFSRSLADDRVRAWIAETTVGKCAVGYAVAVSDDDAKSFSSFELKRLYAFYRFHGNGVRQEVNGGRVVVCQAHGVGKSLASSARSPTTKPLNSTAALVSSNVSGLAGDH